MRLNRKCTSLPIGLCDILGRQINRFLRYSFINKTLDSQRKQIERSERQDQRDTDEEIEHEMANAKANLANEFDEKANARKVSGKFDYRCKRFRS
jgi:hypothetical protein